MTPSDGVNHGFMFGVGIVDKARTAMSEAREWLRGTPTSRCRAGRSIVAPENPPTPISYRLVRASRSGPYSAVMTRTGGRCIPLSRAQPAPAQIARHGF